MMQGICDGASAVILASEEACSKHDLTPLARLVDYKYVCLFLREATCCLLSIVLNILHHSIRIQW